MRGVFLDKYPLDLGDVDMSAIDAQVADLTLYDLTAPDEVAARIRDVELVMLNKVRLTRDLMQQAEALKLVILSATGTDNIDLEAATELGITVCNCRAYATASVVQHTLSLILAMVTRLVDYDRAVREHSWEHAHQFCLLQYPIRELRGRRIGIVGYGELGSGVARVAEAFGMRVMIAERPGAERVRDGRLAFDQVLESADVVSLHCPSTPHTHRLINVDSLGRMRRDAFLINTARGALVDEPALAQALRRGDIAGAALDVLSQEPPRDGNPLLANDIPNLLITPHCAWGSVEARQRAVDQIAESIRGFQNGQPVRALTSPD